MFLFRPSIFHDREVRVLILGSGESIEETGDDKRDELAAGESSGGLTGDIVHNFANLGIVAPTEVVGLSVLLSLTGLWGLNLQVLI